MSFTPTLLILALTLPVAAQTASADMEAQAQQLRALLHAAPKLPLRMMEITVKPPSPGWRHDFVSSATFDSNGDIYLLQRGEEADPVLVINSEGRILRSWGKGLFKIPHSIRIDPEGNVWTVDAGSSMVHKFTREGKPLLE